MDMHSIIAMNDAKTGKLEGAIDTHVLTEVV